MLLPASEATLLHRHGQGCPSGRWPLRRSQATKKQVRRAQQGAGGIPLLTAHWAALPRVEDEESLSAQGASEAHGAPTALRLASKRAQQYILPV